MEILYAITNLSNQNHTVCDLLLEGITSTTTKILSHLLLTFSTQN